MDLQIIHSGFLDHTCDIRSRENETTLSMSWLGESATFRFNEEKYYLARRHLFSGEFLLQRDGQLLAAARKTSFLRRFEVDTSQQRLMLRAASPFSSNFKVEVGGTEAGQVASQRWFSRSFEASLPDWLSFPEEVFLIWLVLLVRRRSQSAAAPS
ncbi:MAG: hypothetical protein HYZ00_01575 [Candidatus Hydrogenedentes bacterium]|nr:hypothetical protein [Candidatus Hydrogenedentota bacterium]